MLEHTSQPDDMIFMKKALRLATYGAGSVSPNPLVGAVIVKAGRIIGKGYHKKYGGAHAEIQALNNTLAPMHGATLYCNLEPCSHTEKQTPPCVPVIVKAGVKRVVIANIDPNPHVNGKGIAALRKAGLQVDTGVGEKAGLELNRFFFKFISEQRPYVTVKYAQTIDGFIARERTHQERISGEKVQKMVHRLRTRYDAVLIGAQTMRADNPHLTVRRIKGRDPFRIIFSASLDLDLKQNVFNHPEPEKTWIFTTEKANRDKMTAITNLGCRVIPLNSTTGNRFAIGDILHVLADQRITSLLVEGGQQVITAFLQTGFVDELKIIVSPKIWGRGYRPLQESENPEPRRYRLMRLEKMDDDSLLTYRPA